MVIVFKGQPGIKTTATTSMSFLIEMNKFLESLENLKLRLHSEEILPWTMIPTKIVIGLN